MKSIIAAITLAIATLAPAISFAEVCISFTPCRSQGYQCGLGQYCHRGKDQCCYLQQNSKDEVGTESEEPVDSSEQQSQQPAESTPQTR
jgi:hypothetical protein